MSEFHAAGARSSEAHGELSQKQHINFPKVVQQQYVHVGELNKSIAVVSVWDYLNTICI